MPNRMQRHRLNRQRKERARKAEAKERKPQKGRHVPDDRGSSGGR
jgi:hypothetical protein